MKKLFTIIALMFVMIGRSQSPEAPPNVIIYTILPTGNVCPGDTLTVFFRWNNAMGFTTFRLVPQFGQQQGWTYANAQFYQLPKTLIGVDTIYEIKLDTWVTFPLGLANMTPDLITYWPMNFACDVGIKEEELDPKIPIYYDIYGNRIQPRNNELLIEQRGRNRKKVIIQD